MGVEVEIFIWTHIFGGKKTKKNAKQMFKRVLTFKIKLINRRTQATQKRNKIIIQTQTKRRDEVIKPKGGKREGNQQKLNPSSEHQAKSVQHHNLEK